MFHWPIPDDHIIYIGGKRSLKSSEDAKELLGLVENSNLCEGLPQDDNTKSVVVDPTWEQGQGLSDFPQSNVEDMPSTSSAILPVSTLKDLRKQLDERAILPWTVDKATRASKSNFTMEPTVLQILQ